MNTKENPKQQQLVFPDINTVLYSDKPILLESAMDEYRKLLLASNTPYNTLYANKLLENKDLTLSKNLISLKKDISQLQKHLATWSKKKGYTFPIIIQKRKKSEIKFNDKIRLFLTKMFVYGEDLTLDSILDTLGIRIILCLGDVDTLEHILLCRDVLMEVINFFTIEKGYNPHRAEPKLFVGFDSKEHPEVVVPNKETLIPEEFRIYVKDYYSDPKTNTYQSFHIVFKTKCGLPLEVQIRTQATHVRVEYLKAPHDVHDAEKYPDPIVLKRENINVFGYSYVTKDETEHIEDFVGLEKAIDPFNMLY